MITPFYSDESVTLYCGDMREVVPGLALQADCIVTDPPYGETKLGWDAWPDGWPAVALTTTASMWCFGSLRMFMNRRHEFEAWRLSQDIVWEKHNGSSFASDRFKRVHEQATHWYHGQWSDVHHVTPTTSDASRRTVRQKDHHRAQHLGEVGRGVYLSEDGGPRLMRSVIAIRSMHGRAIHPTEKPIGLLDPLIRYACPPGGVVLDPFAGSGSTGEAARMSGRRAVLVEADERYCERIAAPAGPGRASDWWCGMTVLHPDVKAARGLCAVPGCTSPGVATVSVSSNRVAFRTDHAQIPAWADRLRCWSCAGAELDRLISTAGVGGASVRL